MHPILLAFLTSFAAAKGSQLGGGGKGQSFDVSGFLKALKDQSPTQTSQTPHYEVVKGGPVLSRDLYDNPVIRAYLEV